MSTPHNEAANDAIAKTVLLPGDPLRAQFIAENFLENAVRFNAVRNMFGFTGTYKGARVSVMGTGMGVPSIGIYSYELIHFYHVKNLIRIGSCGGMDETLKLGDLLLAMGSSTDSNYAHQYQLPGTFSATADYGLLSRAKEIADRENVPNIVGNVLCSDLFYSETQEWKVWAKMGIKAAEMESYALYCNASRAGVKALAMFTVSDSMVTGEGMSAHERQVGFKNMMKVALEVALSESVGESL